MYIEKTFAQKLRTFLTFAAFPLFAFTIVLVIPFLVGVFLSFTDWNGIQAIDSFDYNWIGLTNFTQALNDPTYMSTLGMTVAYVISVVIFTNVIGFLVAVLVTSNLPARNFFRAAFFVPNLIGGVILGFIWQFIFSTFLTRVGDILGIPALQFSWLVETDKAFTALVIVGVWQLSGYMMLIYIAGLVNIPDEVIEAARIDGANTVQQMTQIKIPLMVQAFTISIFLTLRNSFMVFDVNLSLTRGGPFRSTEMATLHIYNESFISQHFGPAQAQAIILFAIVAVVATTQVLISKRLESRSL
ncbi:MAG: sugar ABC transporter permease [Anaerolineae bacterium]|nr:sugar ABC transporter permease [Anaerolineae bacterium]